MKKILSVILATTLTAALSACVVAGPGYTVSYEPDVVVGLYPVGFYNPAYGYWTGSGWDVNFYVYGHGGYGHYYRGAPGYARGHYRGYAHGGYRGHR